MVLLPSAVVRLPLSHAFVSHPFDHNYCDAFSAPGRLGVWVPGMHAAAAAPCRSVDYPAPCERLWSCRWPAWVPESVAYVVAMDLVY